MQIIEISPFQAFYRSVAMVMQVVQEELQYVTNFDIVGWCNPSDNAQYPRLFSILVTYIAQQYAWQTQERVLLISQDDFALHTNNSE